MRTAPGSARVADILYVEMSRFPSYGGTKRVVVNLARELDRTRFHPRVLFYKGGPWVADLDADGIPVIVVEPPGGEPKSQTAASPRFDVVAAGESARTPRSGGDHRPAARHLASDLLSWLRFLGRDRVRARRLVREVPASTRLIHVSSSMVSDYSWYHVARWLGIPFVTHEHGTWRPRTAAYRTVAARAASVLCLTEERVGILRDHLHGRVRADFLPNGVPVERLKPLRDRASVRAELGVSLDLPIIITAGHLQAWKGQALAVEAAATLARRGLEFLWILCGRELEPGYAAALHRRIADAELSGKVRLLGERSDLPDLFAASDLAAHTSIEPEPFGLVVLEAMLQGIPVVGPREGALPAMIRDGVEGRLIRPRDADALAAAVFDLVGSLELRRAMGEAARSRVRESFDVRCQARRLEGIYERALGWTSGDDRPEPGAYGSGAR